MKPIKSINFIYDGSFEGFLTCIYYFYDYKLEDAVIQRKENVQHSFLTENENVNTDSLKAERVWKGICKKISKKGSQQFYYAFLSEKTTIESELLEYTKQILISKIQIDKDYANPVVLNVSKIAKMVSREKHRMEAFVRFKLTKEGIYFANIEPDFNVLPLIMKHFKSRYADQKWIVFDLKRRYGIYYDLAITQFITLEFDDSYNPSRTDGNMFSVEEFEFQELWKEYFKSTNIESRKNMKLHIRHVPKRYWKYLSEKQP